MIYKNICTIFLFHVSVLSCATVKNVTPSQQSQLDEIRAQLSLQSQLQAVIMNKLYELNRRLTLLPTLVSPPNSCETAALGTRSGIHQILIPDYSRQWLYVSCDEDTQGGGWTTVLRRQDGSVDFYLSWDDYKRGFGNLTGEFFIGLQILHFMTKAGDQELLITMENAEGDKRFAKYDRFVIGGEEEAFKLISLGKYSGNAGDSLQSHLGQKFTTRDYDNDQYNKGNCAQNYTGGWWYNNCLYSNLMGKYNDKNYGKGIIWYSFMGNRVSLKRVQMMIRPRRDRKSS